MSILHRYSRRRSTALAADTSERQARLVEVSEVAEQSSDRDDREDEPLAEHDAVDCEVPAEACDFQAGEKDGTADNAEASLRDEIAETYQPETIAMVLDPVDGLPIPAREQLAPAKAHPFTYETVVCVEDNRTYVELTREEMIERGWTLSESSPPRETWMPPSAVEASFRGRVFTPIISSRYGEDGNLRPLIHYGRDFVVFFFGHAFVRSAALEGRSRIERDRKPDLIPVRPMREKCKHFMRQIMANDDVPEPDEFGHFIIFRNCAARKSVGGALMTLRDEAMYACDYRSPPDPESVEKHLDSRDRDRLDNKRHLEMLPLFGIKEGQ